MTWIRTRTLGECLADSLVASVITVTFCLTLAAGHAEAATRTWTGLVDGNWTNAANWSGAAAPLPNDDLVFPAGALNTTNTNDFADGTAFNSIQFNASYTVSGNRIVLGVGGLQLVSATPATVTFGPPVTLAASQTWGALVSRMTVTGAVHLNGQALTLNPLDGSAAVDISGVIDGTGSLTKNGSGDSKLSGNNTYAGLTTINVGRLLALHGNALGMADGTAGNGTIITSTDFTNSGCLVFMGVAIGNEALTVNGFGVTNNGALQSYAPSSLAGPVTLASGTRFNGVSGSLTLSGVVSGPGLIEDFNGPLTLSNGANSYTGGTRFHQSPSTSHGTLIVGADHAIPGSPTIDLVAADTIDLNNHAQTLGGVTGTGTIGLPLNSALTLNGDAAGGPYAFAGQLTGIGFLEHTGAGEQIFSGTSTFSGSLSVNGGTVTVATGVLPASVSFVNSGRLALKAGGTVGGVMMGSGGTLAISDTSMTPLTGNSATVTLTSGSTFEIAGTPLPTIGKLSATGTVALAGATLSLNVAPGTSFPLGSTYTIIDNDGSDPVVGTFAGLAEGATVTASNGGTFRISYVGGTGNDVVLTALTNAPHDYLLSEGATSGFFTTDILLANPNSAAVPIHITYLKDDGTTVPQEDTLAAMSHKFIRVNLVPGMDSTAFSTVVRSLDGSPVIVERTMSWDRTGYGAHTEHATDGANTTWYFAEGSQGFFHTYLLLANPQSTANSATVQYLIEGGAPVTRTYPLAPTSRFTVDVGADAALVNQSFGMIVTFAQPGAAERAMYFGDVPLFNGGHESAGVNAPSTTWFLAEGATGPFFETFVLLANPGDTSASVTLTYLPLGGSPITDVKGLNAHARMTVNLEEQPALANAAVSTQIVSTQPILVERSQYWPDPAPNWYEAHNSFGVTALATKWGLSEGRVGNVDSDTNAQTYILLANPGTTAANVSITFLRDDPATNVTHTFKLDPQTRFNVPVGPGTSVPELTNEHFGALVTSDQPIAVERALYWDANGQVWAAGTNATATRLP